MFNVGFIYLVIPVGSNCILVCSCAIREKLNVKEGQKDSTPVDILYSTLTKRGFRCYPEYKMLSKTLPADSLRSGFLHSHGTD